MIAKVRAQLGFALMVSAVVVAACSSGSSNAIGGDGTPMPTASTTATTAAPPPPSTCESRQCGAGGPSGSCGTCSELHKCSAAGLCEASAPSGVACPASGPFGVGVGKIAADGELPLAQGGSYQLSAHCSKPVYVLGVTEDCGICMSKLGRWSVAGGFLDQLKTAGADVVLVSTSDAKGAKSTPEIAEGLRKRFALGDRFVLAYEPLGRADFKSFVGKRTNMAGARIALVLKPGNVTGALGQVDEEAEIRAALGLKQ